ncbi:hypothetical protein [Liquorilactobacillus mali]|uniref:hypothetical protein n=2 Tax=Liquorilactobacillus mali TaxID=1618 RepID=UPI0012E96EFB|nr:hypothetical protein [Liquorilactobacillus mali]
MSPTQLIFTILGFMGAFTILFFILFFQMINVRKKLRKRTLIFKQELSRYKNECNTSGLGDKALVVAGTYHPAKSLKKILGLNMIPTFILLGTFFLKFPFI